MYKKCAICGKGLAFVNSDLCKYCYENYRNEQWAKALIKIERHNNHVDYIQQKRCLSLENLG